jgi:MFS family permease
MGQCSLSHSPNRVLNFGADLASVQWVLNRYVLALASLTLAGGVLADVYGKRRVLSISGLAFGIASGACAFAPSVSWLVLVRVLQRIAARNPCADKPRLHRCNLFRRRTQAVDRSLGLGVGICGCLSEQLGWQWVFSINPPLGLIAIGLVAAILAGGLGGALSQIGPDKCSDAAP